MSLRESLNKFLEILEKAVEAFQPFPILSPFLPSFSFHDKKGNKWMMNKD